MKAPVTFAAVSLLILVAAWIIPGQSAVVIVARTGYAAAALSTAWLVLAGAKPLLGSVRSHWRLLIATIPAVVFVHAFQPHEFKIDPDEYVIANTARSIAIRGTAVVTVETWREGEQFAHSSIIDKRPLGFPSVVAMVHTIVGYNPRNAIYVNAGLSAVLIWLTGIFGAAVAGTAGAAVGIAFWPALPVAHYAFTSGGNETFALCTLLVLLLATLRFLKDPSGANLSLAAAATVVACQARPESPLLAAPFVVMIFREMLRSTTRISPPLWGSAVLLLPTILIRKITSGQLWDAELSLNGVAHRFSASFVPHNLKELGRFVFSFDGTYPNSPWIAVAAVLAATPAAFLLVRQRGRVQSVAFAGIATGALFVAVSAVYFFGQWTELVVVRTTLPFYFGLLAILVLATAFLHGRRRGLAYAVPVILLGAAALVTPKLGSRRYVPEIQVLTRVLDEWQTASAKDSLWITSTPAQAIVNNRPAIVFERANAMSEALLQPGTYSKVYVVHWLARRGDKFVETENPLSPVFRLGSERRMDATDWALKIEVLKR